LQDLQDIWNFIASDNVRAADNLEEEFFEAFESMPPRPRMGHTRSDLTYLIVYRTAAAALEIVAVLHGARDLRK
jgi:plasmid stabilization system protein ParE